jgi:protein-tyrosine-phosphatase
MLAAIVRHSCANLTAFITSWSLNVKLKVLFLCATNGVQSPMAEALLKALDAEHFEVMSAGIDRVETHPLTVEVMKETGIDLEGRVAKTAQDVLGLRFDFVITLCDRARSECPMFHQAEVVHWRFDNPMAARDHAQQKRMFQSLRDQITHRVRLFALVHVRTASARVRPHATPAA